MFGALPQIFLGETDDPRRWIGWDRRPVARSDRDPDPARHLIGQAVESERRDHGYHALGDALGDLGERLVCVDVASRILVEARSEEHTSELQSLMRISYAVFCLKNKK